MNEGLSQSVIRHTTCILLYGIVPLYNQYLCLLKHLVSEVCKIEKLRGKYKRVEFNGRHRNTRK